jgi:hypothetical protein
LWIKKVDKNILILLIYESFPSLGRNKKELLAIKCISGENTLAKGAPRCKPHKIKGVGPKGVPQNTIPLKR